MADEVQNATAPAEVPARLDRADRLSFAITTLIALAVYLFTLAPEVTLTFSGELTTAAMYQGVAHPPAYPVWTLYSWIFIKLLPFSNPAWRVAVGSAVAGSIACGLVALIVSHSGRLLFHEPHGLESPNAPPSPSPLRSGGEGRGEEALRDEGETSFDVRRPVFDVRCSQSQAESFPPLERFSPRDRILIRIICGSVAGLALGFSGRFWHEAVNQEVWTFTVLMFVFVLYFLLRWITTGRRSFCWCAFFAYGLVLTDNQELMIGLPGLALAVMLIEPKFGRDVSILVLPLGAAISLLTGYPLLAGPWWSRPMLESFAFASLVALAIVIATRRIGSEWKSALACAAFFSLGLAVYFYVPIASMTNPPMNWGYPRTVEGFFHVISRGQYELVNPTADFTRFRMQLWALLKVNGREFGWYYLIFAALPFCFLPRLSPIARKWALSLLPIFFCTGPLLLTLLNPDGDRISWDLIFEPYFFTLRTLLAIWAGIGLMLFATMTSRSGPTK